MTFTSSRWLTISATARRMGLSRDKVRDLLAKRLLSFTTIEDRRLVSVDSIEALTAARFTPARTDGAA